MSRKIRLVILDDEIWALRGLSEIINWESLDFEKCGFFDDPVIALESFKQNPPDVVFTDIRMPGMSGLELIEQTRTFYDGIIFVVVSAYSDFQYAQKALDNGAFAYILKPLIPEQVFETASRISSKFRKQQLSLLQESIQKYVINALLRNDFISPEKSIQEIIDQIGNYRVAVIKHTDRGNTTDTASDFFGCPFSPSESIRFYPADHPTSNLPGCHIGESAPGYTGTDLPVLIRQAMEACYTAEFLKKDKLTYTDEKTDRFGPAAEQVFTAVRSGDKSDARAMLSRIHEIIGQDSIMLSNIVLFYNKYLDEIQRFGSSDDFRDMLDSFADYFQLFSIMGNITLLFENLRIMLDVIDTNLSSENPMENEIVREIVQYVDNNFTKGITLEQLSIKFHISLSHISRQFKRITGMTYSNYVSEKKIEKAKYLLAHSKDTIAEVGEKAGYADYFYFLKSFKKATGFSPTQYRKESCG